MEHTKKSSLNRGKHKSFAPLGGVIWGLALVGLAAVVVWSVNFTRSLLDNSKEREKFEQFLLPVVMMDPVPFNTIENANEDFILQASLWAALLGDSRQNYSYDEVGMLLVPASDVDVAATKLFGPNVTVVHRSFDDVEGSYMFDESIQAYRVPVTAKVSYSPRVETITKKGDTILLRVGYVPPGNVWTTDMDANKQEPEPEKYMNYELVKGDNGYYIKSVQDVEENLAQPPRS